MKRSLILAILLLIAGHMYAQHTIPFDFTSEEDNKLVRENDTVKYYIATSDSTARVAINEETSYYRLLNKERKVLAEGAFAVEAEKYLQVGKWTQYFDNGKVKRTGYYYRGKPIGMWEEFYNTGKPKLVYNYAVLSDKDGYNTCLSGGYQEFYASGRLKVNGYYSAERSKTADTVTVEDPVSGDKVRKIVSHSAYRSQKACTWEYYTEEGEIEKKEEL